MKRPDKETIKVKYDKRGNAEIILSGLCDKTLGAGSSTLRIIPF